ncbi:MAG: hypothetical protein ACE5ER_09185 [Nitrospinaceae bacterium]
MNTPAGWVIGLWLCSGCAFLGTPDAAPKAARLRRSMNTPAGWVIGLWLCSGCAFLGTPDAAPKDAQFSRDNAECRSLSGMDNLQRGTPSALRKEALYLKCLRQRGWEP